MRITPIEELPAMTEAEYKEYVKNHLKIGMICVLNCKDPESDEGVGRRTRKKEMCVGGAGILPACGNDQRPNGANPDF